MMNLIFRHERPGDYRETENVTREAFWNVYAPGCTEHYLLHTMRQSPDFVPELDLVAVCDGQIVGNVVCAESHIECDDNTRRTVLSLGPISVLPAFQRNGIGRKLVGRMIEIASGLGYEAILLCGDPLLYSGYGFVPAGEYGILTADGKMFSALQVHALNDAALERYSGRYFESPVYEIDMEQAEIFDRDFPEKEKLSGTPTQLRFNEIIQELQSD